MKKDILKRKTLKVLAKASIVLSVGLAPIFSMADSFPNKDIRIIVPFAPGGAVDVTSRIISEFANKELSGIKMKVENRSGGGGVVGQTYGKNAKPDGYTVLAMTSSVVTNPVTKNAPYSLADFEPVALYTLDPEVIAVPANSPYKTIDDLVKDLKTKTLNFATSNVGTSHDLSAKALKMKNPDLKIKIINSKAFSAQLQAVLGNHVDGAFWPLGEAKAHMDSGSIRILAVAARQRMDAIPNVPTWKESSLSIVEWGTFRGWAVPAGTDKKVVNYLANLLKKINQNSDYVSKMKGLGFPIVYADADGFRAVIKNYDSLTKPIVKKK